MESSVHLFLGRTLYQCMYTEEILEISACVLEMDIYAEIGSCNQSIKVHTVQSLSEEMFVQYDYCNS